jgi:hypothetical protein
VIVTLSSSEQSRFISCFFHQRSPGDRHVYVRKHPNSAHASSADFFEKRTRLEGKWAERQSHQWQYRLPKQTARALAYCGLLWHPSELDAAQAVAQFSEWELLRHPNLGRRRLEELKIWLARHGLVLRGPAATGWIGLAQPNVSWLSLAPLPRDMARLAGKMVTSW